MISTQGYMYWQNKARFQFDHDTDSHWIMYIIESGRCEYQFDNFKGIAGANDILLIPPYCDFFRSMVTPMTFHFIRITSKLESNEQQLTGRHHFANQRFIENCTILRKTTFNLSQQAQAIRAHIVQDLFIQNNLEQLQSHHLDLKQAKNRAIAKATIIMQNRLDLTISEIAHLVDLNPAYFSRNFKQVIGESPIIYYTKLKLKKVQEYLITTDDSLSEIADKTGFNDAFYLSRTFSKYLKCSPIHYRKKHII
ncbi:AraC family transcriptional regulator [Latilactobacillus sakei]|uniref:AraC family transcriptional regulator n=1 Tax=Latilactobacillus sakei TaxID=1599 RepID=UPI001EE433BE|nr:helix-turn-helix transcriptional regulator [Latilactobacillus sakei]MDB1552709.1 helix-turn-helix transcriptional regulator [Latilactobacillus sakei]